MNRCLEMRMKDREFHKLMKATFIATETIIWLKVREKVANLNWHSFCVEHGYDHNAYTNKAVDEYLDTWVGSVEEERVFNNLPAMEV